MYHAPGDVRIGNIAVPEPGRGEVLVRVGAALESHGLQEGVEYEIRPPEAYGGEG